MALRGTKPKPEGQARHRNKSVAEWVEVADIPYAGPVPDLPKTRTVFTRDGMLEVELRPLTLRWWETITRMPHCVLWSDSDWMFAVATAVVADQAFCGTASSATELRNREKVLGVTADFRRDLRIRYVDSKPSEQASAGVANLDDYRDL